MYVCVHVGVGITVRALQYCIGILTQIGELGRERETERGRERERERERDGQVRNLVHVLKDSTYSFVTKDSASIVKLLTHIDRFTFLYHLNDTIDYTDYT